MHYTILGFLRDLPRKKAQLAIKVARALSWGGAMAGFFLVLSTEEPTMLSTSAIVWRMGLALALIVQAGLLVWPLDDLAAAIDQEN